jgi:hypothetical protein
MRRFMCAIGLLLLPLGMCAGVEVDFTVVKRLSLPGVPQRYFQAGDKLVIVTSGTPRALILDLRTLRLEAFPVEPIVSVVGVDRRGVVSDQYFFAENGGGHREIFFYDIKTGVRTELSKGVEFAGSSHVYYQNEETFEHIVHSESDQELSRFSLKTGKETGLGWRPGVSSAYLYPPHVISSDKQTLVVEDFQGFTLYHPSTSSFGPTFRDPLGGGGVHHQRPYPVPLEQQICRRRYFGAYR